MSCQSVPSNQAPVYYRTCDALTQVRGVAKTPVINLPAPTHTSFAQLGTCSLALAHTPCGTYQQLQQRTTRPLFQVLQVETCCHCQLAQALQSQWCKQRRWRRPIARDASSGDTRTYEQHCKGHDERMSRRTCLCQLASALSKEENSKPARKQPRRSEEPTRRHAKAMRAATRKRTASRIESRVAEAWREL